MSLNGIEKSATGEGDLAGHLNVQRWEGEFTESPGRAAARYKCKEVKHGASDL